MNNTEELVTSNIILQGEFDPVKFDKLFFVKNDVFNEQEFDDNSLFSKNVVRISTEDFIINISKKQIVISFRKRDIDRNKISKLILSFIIENKFSIAFNQKWFKVIEDINSVTKQKFYPLHSNYLNEYFNVEDAAFGYYASKNIDDGRFRIDIKPATLKSIVGDNELNVMSFDFSYYFEVIRHDFNANNKLDLLDNESENLMKNF